MSNKELIVHHVKASGPVSFQSICSYIQEQGTYLADFFIAEDVNALIVAGEIKLYDDGVSFI
jgi:hypothetical protein